MSDFPDDQWAALRLVAESETGMDFSGSRVERLEDAVRRLERLHPDVRLEKALADPDRRGPLLERLTALLTIGESYFFRNQHHMRALRERILPEIIEENSGRKQIRVWSAGCATGEEPYSLAILLQQMLGTDTDWDLSILGTDLNPEFLSRAREGLYRRWSFRQTEVHHDSRWFRPEGDRFRIAATLRRHVRFEYLNLVKDVYPSSRYGTAQLDLIVFRNVAIYLRPDVTLAVLERMHQCLRPGGWLLLGETELSATPRHLFDMIPLGEATVLRRRSTPPVRPRPMPAPVPGPVLRDVRPPRLPPTITEIPDWLTLPDWVPLPERTTSKSSDESGSTTQSRLAEAVLRQDFITARRLAASEPDPVRRAQGSLQIVRSLWEAGRSKESRADLQQVLKDDPLCVEAHLLMARLYEDEDQWAAAEQGYRRVLYLDRNCSIAQFQLGLLLDRLNRPVEAARAFAAALRSLDGRDPHQPVEFGDGVCYGRLKEMVNTLSGAIP